MIGDRARGSLYGLAIGDALGMPTQSLSRSLIISRYGALVTEFAPGAPDHPIAPDRPAGSVTDDTEQALLLARMLVERRGRVDPADWADRLLRWEDRMRARGSLDLLGPSTRRALRALEDGADPSDSGRAGSTNGAAMRIAPVGIAVASGDPAALVRSVVAVSALTHNTAVALAGAAAVAMAVSAALDGADLAGAIADAMAAADMAAAAGPDDSGDADMADRIRDACLLVAGRSVVDAVEVIGSVVGTSLQAGESVPAAFAAVRAADGDPWAAVCIGASVGGDCDTIAAMAGAMAGALAGVAALPAAAIDWVRTVNDLPIDELTDGLLALRARP